MPPTEITTPRLHLRPLTGADLDSLHALLTQPGVRRYLLDDQVIPRDRAQFFIDTSVMSFAANGYGLWGARDAVRDELMGFCGFWQFGEPPRLELLYGLADDRCHQGFATEMAQAMVHYGFDALGFERIDASTDAANSASVAVMERAGMKFWKRELTNGLDTVYYAISAAPGSRRGREPLAERR
jgi:RimJ/RimL family protein N-acetyltransferase